MNDPEDFDAFYLRTRDRLLLQTYALTGDLGASRSAVRDTFVVAWHHWRKISRLTDREGWARPHAWLHAQRRHTARIWHRDRTLDPDVAATLATLATLTPMRRRLLLLDQLTGLDAASRAREAGMVRSDGDRELAAATLAFCYARDVEPDQVPSLLAPLSGVVEQVSWPRPSTIRHTGAARRRTHTLVGAAAAVTALLVTGSLVTTTTGVHPSLARSGLPAAGTSAAPETPDASETAAPAEPTPQLDASRLLRGGQVREFVDGTPWTMTATHDNTEGDGLVTPCQQARFADPEGTASLVRTFGPPAAREKLGKHRRAIRAASGPAVVQAVERSTTGGAARQALATTTQWYAACAAERVQLLSTHDVEDIGNRARVLVLRSWAAPASTVTVGVARTGKLTVTTLIVTPGLVSPNPGRGAGLLARAVNNVCDLPESGPCATGRPRPVPVPPLPTGRKPAMLSTLDLPPVGGVRRPWVGTDPVRAKENVASTLCDGTSFSGEFRGAPFSRNLTRSFLIPEAKLPAQFGVTETVGALPGPRAAALVAQVRTRLAGCEDEKPGTQVVQVEDFRDGPRELTVWHVTTEVSDDQSVRFLMAIMRSGTSVAQLGFVPARGVQMPAGAFITLARRALERLDQLPAPAGSKSTG